MPGGSNTMRDNQNRDRQSGGGGSSKGGSSDKGHYYRETVRTVKEAAIRYADARDQVNKTETGSKERVDALKELVDAGKNLDLVK